MSDDMRSEIIDALMATSGLSEGVAADAIMSVFRNWQSQQAQGERGRNRYGVDMSYFHSLFKRELTSLDDFTPDELARVLARAAKTACADVLAEPEFQKPAPAAVPDVTPEMLRAAQLNSELGAYAASSWAGAYDVITELFVVMAKAQYPALEDPK